MPGDQAKAGEGRRIPERHRWLIRGVGWFWLVVGVVVLGVGVVLLYRAYDFSSNAVRVDAVAVDVDEHSDEDGTTYSATFVFLDAEGNEHRVRPWYSASWFPSREGQHVEIFYDPRDPERIGMTGWFPNWGFPVAVSAGSWLAILIGAFALTARIPDRRAASG